MRRTPSGRMVQCGLPPLEHVNPVVGTAAGGYEAVGHVLNLQPDVVLMDILMPALNGIEATERITRSRVRSRIVMLTMVSSPEYIVRAFRAGACGFVLKESAIAEVIEAIRTVHAGGQYLSRRLADIPQDELDQTDTSLERLSSREREVLQAVVEGKSNAEIAALLCLSPKSVETYSSRLRSKLGIDDLAGLTRYALRHGLISLE